MPKSDKSTIFLTKRAISELLRWRVKDRLKVTVFKKVCPNKCCVPNISHESRRANMGCDKEDEREKEEGPGGDVY